MSGPTGHDVAMEPTGEQLAALHASGDAGPVVMLNLLRFKDRATGIDAADGITGAEAYGRYGVHAQRFLAGAGGRVLHTLSPHESVIGPVPGEWDLVLVVEYPSRQAFLAMISDPDYLAIHEHRAAGLADSRLIACSSLTA
ncbi:MAG TPA: DUF1330 domain-containing protein [Solirubrobacteraceae bacterium]|jgi:uncharacterized protein (DUF1330 family)